MSSTPREIGTLIVVILKAVRIFSGLARLAHPTAFRHIGKQDPYCLVAVNGEKQRTKVVKRGGQHPEWDEEIRFTLYEDDAVASNGQAPPPPPPKDGKKTIKGGSVMKLSCFADDPREPDLIGQADVDLTEVLTKGETDEWFTLMNKDKFAGKVYLELTFWSNEPPPEKKVAPLPPKDYVGPGDFVSFDEPRAGPGPGLPSSRIASTSSSYAHSRRTSDSVPSSIRSSNSLAQLELYRPPYEQEHHRSRVASFSALTNDFGELGIGDPNRRRESFPPPQSTMYAVRPPSSTAYSTYPPPSHGYEHSVSDAASMYSYDRPLTPPGQPHDLSSFGHPAPYTPQAPYRPQYDSGSGGYHPPPPSGRGPRYSMPTTSSGFRLSNSSSFTSHPSDPSGFAPPLTHAPAPMGYTPSHITPPTSYAPGPSQTPGPAYAPPPPPSSSTSFHSQQGFPPSQSFQYSQFQPQPPPQQYNPSPPTHMQTPAPPQQQGYPLPPSPTHQSPGPSLSHSNSLSSSTGPGSRPLPLQPQYHAPQGHQPYGLPPSSSQPQHPGSYSPTHQGSSTFQDSYQPAPPPPPPPPGSLHQNIGHQSYFPPDPQGGMNPLYQPPPPPPAPLSNTSPRRQSSLPPPPTHLQQPNYPPLPPPPPPPPQLEYSPHNPPPPPPPLPSHVASQSQSYYPGPPPRPPTQIDSQAQWSQPHPSQPPQNSYVQQGWN
ncbi:hypothetical protein DFH09DRAFT_1389567 [Mycena vulgaris]|nr:hypothetical protein DFH09DRAFT_1389567 [Mycena vulgaris]